MKRAGIIKNNDDSADKPKRARYAGDAETYHESDLSTSKRLREERVEVRKEYTSAATAKGADGDGIAESTNWLYRILFGEKPKGNRDEWDHKAQQHTMTGEHFATNRIKDLPTPKEGSAQYKANDRVVEATKDGARAAREFLNDEDTPGAASTLWGWMNPKTIWEEGEEESRRR